MVKYETEGGITWCLVDGVRVSAILASWHGAEYIVLRPYEYDLSRGVPLDFKGSFVRGALEDAKFRLRELLAEGQNA